MKRFEFACPSFSLPMCLSLAVLSLCSVLASTHAGEAPGSKPSLSEPQFAEKIRALEQLHDPASKTREVDTLLRGRWFSSAQVRAIATTLPHDEARFSFALSAWPRTVDPENFYDVYDAFSRFSMVFRLHDRIQPQHGPLQPPPGPVVVQPISDGELADILKLLRKEAFDEGRKALARQILAGQRRFLSRHITEMLKVFTFDDDRLETARFAYDCVLDPENYYLVTQAFRFSSNKEALSRYIESRATERRPPPRR